MPISTTGNALIDSATAEIAVTLRDAGHMRGVCYTEAMRLRDEIIVGALERAGVLPPWRPAVNGSGKHAWFLIRDESVPLAHRYHTRPDGNAVRYASCETAQRAADKLNGPKP